MTVIRQPVAVALPAAVSAAKPVRVININTPAAIKAGISAIMSVKQILVAGQLAHTAVKLLTTATAAKAVRTYISSVYPAARDIICITALVTKIPAQVIRI